MTIQGSGVVGSNTGSLNSNITIVNQAAGTLLANLSGQTLTIAGTGGLTNNGTMQANAGAALNATQGFTNFSAGTPTPEPSSLLLLASGLAGIAVLGYRRRGAIAQ